ncbi:Transcription factor AFT family protein [Candida albicans]|uniref:Transcription factor AFT family protein n=1 Tax=Candida albicans TaxID=5476 RepID=A0A8H6BU11_CANAX|nr:Transcription factor AFT family protein [Candida albicans]
MTDRVTHRVSLDDLNLEKQKFDSKDDIKPWLQDNLQSTKGINVVIERSDTSKIIFKKHTSCPFKIRANYSVRNKVWTLSIVSDEHDHVVDLPRLCAVKRNEDVDAPKISSKKARNLTKKPSTQSTRSSSSSDGSSIVSFGSLTSQSSSTSLPENYKGQVPTSMDSMVVEESLTGKSLKPAASHPVKRKNMKANTMKKSKKLKQNPIVVSPIEEDSNLNSFDDANIDLQRQQSLQSPLSHLVQNQDPISLEQNPQLHTVYPQPRHSKQSSSLLKKNQQQDRIPDNMPLQPQENNRTLQNFPLNQFNANEILQNVQQVVRETVKSEILDSPNIDNTYKTDMMDSFVSSVILDYKDYLSSQFLFSLKQNLYDRREATHTNVDLEQNGSNENLFDEQPQHKHNHQHNENQFSYQSQIQNQRQNQNQNQGQNQNQNQSQSQTPGQNSNQNDSQTQIPLQSQTPQDRKSAMQQNWLPGSTPGVGGLIRLSPLLNDNDNNEYAAVAAAAVVGSTPGNPNGNSLENFTHLPGINSSTLNYLMQLPHPSANPNSGGVSSSQPASLMSLQGHQGLLQQQQQQQPMFSMQNSGQQLPPLSSIPKLPSSNNANVNLNSSSTLPLPLNNTGPTLNPSSLLKSTSRNSTNSGNINVNNINNSNNNSNPTNSNQSMVNSIMTTNSNKDGTATSNNNSSGNTSNNLLNDMPNYGPGW